MKQRHSSTGTRTPSFGAFALAALMMTAIDSYSPATAQTNTSLSPKVVGRYKAPIGHRQPRPQDLPPGVLRDEGRSTATERAFDRQLDICRKC